MDGAVTLFGGMILALAIGWKLALVCIAVVPVILISGFVRVALLARFQVMANKVSFHQFWLSLPPIYLIACIVPPGTTSNIAFSDF